MIHGNASLKPPRYLLRESAVKKILKGYKPGKFLEIGYGEGHMLVTLTKSGFWGDAYDFSEAARQAARMLLERNASAKIALLETIADGALYDYILFFEVIGYWKNPAAEISRLREHLNPGGKIIFSFTNKRRQGHAEKATGDMQCFTRNEIMVMLENELGLRAEVFWNYGYPLANLLRPALDLFHLLRSRRRGAKRDAAADIMDSGLASRYLLVKLVRVFLNPVTVYPFAMMQLLFRNTDLGNGYVVVAGEGQDR